MNKCLPVILACLLFLSACGRDSDSDGQAFPVSGGVDEIADSDKDGVANAIDNCPEMANTDQLDTYGDNRGDVCDIAREVSDSTIMNVAGNIATDTSIVINGSGFSEKLNAKPLFWWKADFNDTPSALGRKVTWDKASTAGLGTYSTEIVAPGSQQSVGTDHGKSSGIALARILFESDRFYLYRKTYEDFDISTDEALRTRVTLVSGTPRVGDVVSGTESGATGTIVAAIEGTFPAYTIQYDNTSGTINAQPPIEFMSGEQMLSSSDAVMTNNESKGIFRTFNFKTIRLKSIQNGVKELNNMHLNAQGAEGAEFRITPEYTDGTTWGKNFTKNRLYQIPRQWKTEELQYLTSSVDKTDGIFNFYQNGILGTDNKFRNRTSDAPNRYTSIVQSQVSHNAQPGSVMYYDSLYLDDTWHRVIVCEGATADQCMHKREVQIPLSWSDNEITVQVNLGGLDLNKPLYLYVFDKNGEPNPVGWKLTHGQCG